MKETAAFLGVPMEMLNLYARPVHERDASSPFQ